MALDTSAFNNIKTFQDYNQAQQDFNLRKALATQQIQTGGIDAASKANVYATQLLSGAAAGGQDSYDQAKQNLQAQGIDTSNYASDVQTATKQLQAARLAQSPLGTLFNAAQKDQSNQIALGGLTGKITPGAVSPTIPGLSLSPQADGSVQPSLVPQSSAPVASGVSPSSVFPTTNPVAPVNVPALIAGTNLTATGAAPGTEQPAPAVPSSVPAPISAPQTTPFSFRAQLPNETLPAYKDAQQQAFEQYKADPNYQAVVEQGKAKAGALGKAQGDAQKDAVSADANYNQVVQTIGNIKDLVNSPAGLPQDKNFVPAGTQAYLSQNIGGTALGNMLGVAPQAQADNVNAFNKLNESQTIGAIKELASTGQIKMTRTLENILNRGFLVDPSASPASKIQQANVILGELQNSKIATQNVNAGLNGGQPQPYVSPLGTQATQPAAAATASAPPAGATLYGTSGGKPVYKLGNTFLMEQ